MGGALFVSCAATLAGDLALLFRRHRSKSATFFSHSVHSIPPGTWGTIKARQDQAPESPWTGRGASDSRSNVRPTSESNPDRRRQKVRLQGICHPGKIPATHFRQGVSRFLPGTKMSVCRRVMDIATVEVVERRIRRQCRQADAAWELAPTERRRSPARGNIRTWMIALLLPSHRQATRAVGRSAA